MADNDRDILIMGIGNVLMGDDGLGVHAIRELEKTELPGNVEVLDVGTAFIDALPHLNHRQQIIVIDAVKAGKTPGTVYRIEVDPGSYTQESPSIHGMSIINMMLFARCALPKTITLLGIEPDVIDWSMELSPCVSAAKPLLIDAVLREIGMGCENVEVRSA